MVDNLSGDVQLRAGGERFRYFMERLHSRVRFPQDFRLIAEWAEEASGPTKAGLYSNLSIANG
jgi:hypothetical protein